MFVVFLCTIALSLTHLALFARGYSWKQLGWAVWNGSRNLNRDEANGRLLPHAARLSSSPWNVRWKAASFDTRMGLTLCMMWPLWAHSVLSDMEYEYGAFVSLSKDFFALARVLYPSHPPVKFLVHAFASFGMGHMSQYLGSKESRLLAYTSWCFAALVFLLTGDLGFTLRLHVKWHGIVALGRPALPATKVFAVLMCSGLQFIFWIAAWAQPHPYRALMFLFFSLGIAAAMDAEDWRAEFYSQHPDQIPLDSVELGHLKRREDDPHPAPPPSSI